MAYAHQQPLGYHDHHQDSKQPTFYGQDESSVLDSTILDSEVMHSPNASHFRRDSVANSNGVLSPADSHTWDNHYNGNANEPPPAVLPQAWQADGDQQLRRQGQPHPYQPSFQQPSSALEWTYRQGAESGLGITPNDYMPPPAAYEVPRFRPSQPNAIRTNFVPTGLPPTSDANYQAATSDNRSATSTQIQTPMSPHSHQDWMGMAQQEMEGRPITKRIKPTTAHMTMVDLARRDGIRKKNGRIEIPQERTIQTIDDMIDQTTDDDLLKELKQQKRLLRNREAALASRQRKKKHTEDLEVKEKGYAHQIVMLENRLSEVTIENSRREEERQMLVIRFQEAQRLVDALQDQIKDQEMRHNEETSTLRRRVNFLTEQLETTHTHAMSAAPSSTGYTDFNAEMEALNMGPYDWDLNFAEEFHPEDHPLAIKPEPVQPTSAMASQSSSGTARPESRKLAEGSVDQPIASGLLFMLLLCGAFVASKPANLQPRDLPQMPAEVRAAAPTVLSNLLSDAAGPSAQMGPHQGPSANTNYLPRNSQHSAEMNTGRLDRLHSRLISPTKQQAMDQAFALTTTQYASIAHMNHDSSMDSTQAHPTRRNLAEALTSFEQHDPGQTQQQQRTKAEVYTRSLLWDQIPADVVKQFREMVAKRAQGDGQDQVSQQQQQQSQQHEHRQHQHRHQHHQQQQQQHSLRPSHDDIFGYTIDEA